MTLGRVRLFFHEVGIRMPGVQGLRGLVRSDKRKYRKWYVVYICPARRPGGEELSSADVITFFISEPGILFLLIHSDARSSASFPLRVTSRPASGPDGQPYLRACQVSYRPTSVYSFHLIEMILVRYLVRYIEQLTRPTACTRPQKPLLRTVKWRKHVSARWRR